MNERRKATRARVRRAPKAVVLTLSPSTISGGTVSTGTVTLDGPAPAAGRIVWLVSFSSNATVPATVGVPAGSLTATFASEGYEPGS